jgi:hypothetical protein
MILSENFKRAARAVSLARLSDLDAVAKEVEMISIGSPQPPQPIGRAAGKHRHLDAVERYGAGRRLTMLRGSTHCRLTEKSTGQWTRPGVRWQEARKARFLELQARFLHLPPLSAAEVEVERESERKLNAVLAEMFGPKENYGDREVDAACAVLDAREQAND